MNPPEGVIKINYNASWDADSKMGGIRAIARDWNGRLVCGFNRTLRSQGVELLEAKLF